MLLVAMMLLGAAAETEVDVPEVHVITGGLYDAPRLTPMPWGELPPADYRDDGVLLPWSLNLAMTRWWVALDGLPDLFQLQLDRLELIEAAAWSAGIELGEARERHRHVTEELSSPPEMATGLPTWLVATLLSVAGIVLVVGGAYVGWQLHP
jgi:hypothetical protein